MELALFIYQNQHMNSHIKIKYLKFDIFKDYKHWNTFTEHAYNEFLHTLRSVLFPKFLFLNFN